MVENKLEELLSIEKNIYKIYTCLMSSEKENNNEKYYKNIENLDLLLELESKKVDEYFNSTSSDEIRKYINQNKSVVDQIGPSVLYINGIDKYRLSNILSNKLCKLHNNNIYNDTMSEQVLKFIWFINDEINEENKDKILNIQYNLCYLYKNVEAFLLDNMFSFNRKYNVHFTKYNESSSNRLFKIQCMDRQLDDQLYQLMLLKDVGSIMDNEECFNLGILSCRCYIKSILLSTRDQDLENYLNYLSKTSIDKYKSLKMIMGEKKWITGNMKKNC